MRSGFILVIPLLAAVGFLASRPPLLDGVSFSRAVYDADGKLLRLPLSSDDKFRLRLPLSAISPLVVEATLAQEDKHFRRHFGVNVLSLVRAAWQSLTGSRRIGASTLTMQLARVRYGIVSHTFLGKLHQIARALQLELHFTKNEILEAYLNLAPYGGNIEGVGAASVIYFGVDANHLTLPQAASLAQIPKSPLRRNPEGKKTGEVDFRTRAELPFRAPHFVNALPPGGEGVTTLDAGLQGIVERQVKAYLESRATAGLHNASAMIVDHTTMEVKALLGSADFFDESISGQVNGTRAKRSPGSTLKPFLYGLAIDQGLIHPMTMLKDTPSHFADFDPENFDRDFVGPIRAKDALVRSRNVPAIHLANRLRPGLYQFLKDAGVTQLKSELYYGLALTLGGAEMTMEELLRLYAMLGQGGVLRPLRWRKSDPAVAGTRLLSPEASFLVLDMLKDNPRPDQGFRREWLRADLPVAWKTGTSFGFRDAWTAAVFGPYVSAVWVGNFDGKPNPGLIGRDAAAPLLFRIVDAIRAEKRLPASPFVYAGDGLKRVKVCPVSGDLPGPFCKHTTPAWFIPGKSPIRTCAIHREVLVDRATGKRVCDPQAKGAVAEVFEFWPSDLLRLFRQAGMPRRTPPEMDARCPLDARSVRGAAPEITSPRREIEYSVRAGLLASERIPLQASSDADARTLYWFVDEKFVGRAAPAETFFWSPVPGRFMVRVVDDQGRSDAREIRVGVVQ